MMTRQRVLRETAAVIQTVHVELCRAGEIADGWLVHGEQSEVQSLTQGGALRRRSSARQNTTVWSAFRTPTVVIPVLNQGCQRNGTCVSI